MPNIDTEFFEFPETWVKKLSNIKCPISDDHMMTVKIGNIEYSLNQNKITNLKGNAATKFWNGIGKTIKHQEKLHKKEINKNG